MKPPGTQVVIADRGKLAKPPSEPMRALLSRARKNNDLHALTLLIAGQAIFSSPEPGAERQWEDEERFHAHLEDIRQQLSGPAPTPTEKLLIERILVSYTDVCWADIHAFANLPAANDRAADQADRRRSRAAKRLLQAIESLARVRRLLCRPVVVVQALNVSR